MQLFGYNIELRRLTIEDIELVRFHRNSQKINQYMEFREHISENQQLSWFESINNINNNYFLIIADNKKVGLIYGAEIDWSKKITGNGGIFIWDSDYWNTGTPGAASFLLTDTSILLGLKQTYIKVLSTNFRAINFNKQLGYKLLPNQEGLVNQRYVLEIASYLEKRTKSLKMLFPKLQNNKVKVVFSKPDIISQFYLKVINDTLYNKEYFEIIDNTK